MIFITEDLDFDNLTSDQVHHLVPKQPLGAFSWDVPVRPLPFIDYDLRSYREAVKGFYQRLTFLRCARNTRHSPTDAQIEAFTRYLVENQRDNPELHFGHGSWAIPEDTTMPGDAAIDFAFTPSYLAIAWLVLVKDRYPQIAKNVKGVDKALRRGMRFIFIEDLKGSGHDSNRDLLKAVEYLSLGAVFSFIADHMAEYPRLVEQVHAVESNILGKLATATDYSATDAYSRQKALQLIRGGDSDDSLVCPTVWHQWQLSQSAWAYNRVLEIAPSIAARTVFPPVKEKTVEIVQRLREAFHEIKPKHAVFGQRRQVTSDSIELKLDVSFDSSIESAIGQVGVVPWVGNLSSQGFMRALKQAFMSRLSYELDNYFAETEEFKGEEFRVCVAKVNRQSEQYRIFVSARG
ncbi:hypothetical protein SAMN04487880_3461 [Marinobacter sp. es.042]|uniref:hypothetical protein n=1 Tax=Marinobacter sp. es.042 TaxID=1761794 RepID=UPI000B503D6D|nr:hypothetical protein [Marinobacter sp. es.042]SNB59188.1 hypothetical protein SAMN04487880_3461 [Marinobacter sp. es.042]